MAVHIAGRGTIGLGLTVRASNLTLRLLGRHNENLTLDRPRTEKQSTKMELNVIEIKLWRGVLPKYVGENEEKDNAEEMFEHNKPAIA